MCQSVGAKRTKLFIAEGAELPAIGPDLGLDRARNNGGSDRAHRVVSSRAELGM
jgi:hypothetical protein